MGDGKVDFISIGLQLAGGLALFLYAVGVMGDTLKELAGDKMKGFLTRFTKNPLSGIATGTVATTLLDSLSVVIILIQPLVGTVEWISGNAPPGRKLANVHMLFNITGVVIFAWFIPYFHRTLNALIR